MNKLLSVLGLIVVVAFGIGCSQQSPIEPRLRVYPVFGRVEVDGEPAEGLYVTCYPDKGNSEYKLPLGTITGENGKFAFSTYSARDGLPEGGYKLVFKWKELGLGDTVDRLGGAYSDPAKSRFDITVAKGENGDLGIIELSKKTRQN